jgi:F0F1-type ATP synthase assembly protein I
MTSSLLRGFALGLQLGLSFVVPLVVFASVGRWLDARAGTLPLFFLGGIVLAAALGFLLAARAVRKVANQ